MPTFSSRVASRRTQKTIFDPELVMAQRPLKPGSFPVRFRQMCDEVLPDELFADLYTGFGRPPVSPSLLMRLHLLMIRDGCGDEAALENLVYDERWRYMCDVPLPDCSFHPTTLHYFRLRLLFGTIDRSEIVRLKAEGIRLREAPIQRIFEATKRVAVTMGLLNPAQAQYVDSTYILGAAAVQDTFRLLFQGLRQVVQAHGEAVAPETQQELLAVLRRSEYTDEHRKPTIEWRNAEARSALLGELVQDAATLVTVCERMDSPGVRSAVAQLQRLVAQDVEVSEEGQAKIRQGVAKDRQCSVVDPELRHGRKSSSRRFDGYKANLALEPESGLLTAITTTEGSRYDGDALPEILEQTSPLVLGGDNAYAGPEQRAEALEEGTVVLTPSAAITPYHKDRFTLDEEAGTVTCPAGNTAHIGKSGKVKFPAKTCQACAFQGECNPTGKGRTLSIGAHEQMQRDLRALARSAEFQDFLRKRCLVEHAIARFLRWAGRQGRYFGTLKTGLQMLFGAIGHNLDRLGRARARRLVREGELG